MDRPVPRRSPGPLVLPVAAAAVIFGGTLAARRPSGYCGPGGASASERIVGVALDRADNRGGADGDIAVEIHAGQFLLEGDGTIAPGTEGAPCYAVNDRTVGAADNGGTRPLAGIVAGLGERGKVWVLVDPALTAPASGGGTAAPARNIAAGIADAAGNLSGAAVNWPSRTSVWTVGVKPSASHPRIRLELPSGTTLSQVLDPVDGDITSDFSRDGSTQVWRSQSDYDGPARVLVVTTA